MSEPVAKERSDVHFDEFERHYRQQDHHRRTNADEDPLAELARLVGEHHDPYGDVFSDPRIAQEAAEYQAYSHAHRHEPIFEKETGLSPRLSGDFASIEAGLRSTTPSHELSPHEQDYYGAHDPHQHDPHHLDPHHLDAHHLDPHQHQAYSDEQSYLQDHEAQQWAGDVAQEQPAAQQAAKSRRPVYAMVATIAIGVIGVGAAFAYKGSSSSPREIKTIAAASGPTKIAPPAEATSSDQAPQDSAMMTKGPQTAPSQLVSREEQPVDISQAVQDNASSNADAGSAPGDASSVPVPPSPTQAKEGAGVSPSDQIGSFGLSGMPAAKKVKVVSVRPDGTILPTEMPPIGSMPLSTAGSAKPADKPASPTAKAATPKAQDASPKTTSRVAAKPTKAAKPAKVASTDDNVDDTAAKPAKKAKAKPQRVAAAEPTDETDATATVPAKTGGFAVQLAAPGSEADAKSASSRLGKKYADALGGRKLGFRKADSNGKSVYRVRVGGLSKEEAQSLCEKLKSDGGSCFVAKN